jgi:hypothetical protein
VLAAKAAGMRCLAVPDPLLAADARYREADLVLSSLEHLDDQAIATLGVPRAERWRLSATAAELLSGRRDGLKDR